MSSLLDPVGMPPVDPALEPASIRNGTPAAKQAYKVALGFEQMLVGQLTQQLSDTVSGSGDGSDSSDGGDGANAQGAGGLMGSDPASSAYAGLIPTAMSTGIMSAGGLGIAMTLAKAIDPQIGDKR